MAKTKQEIRDWLDSQVGKKIECPNNRSLDGQCVTPVKALLAFLGCNTAWKARGNAKDVGDAYVRDGIAKSGKGWLQICVNRRLGGGYGHVWIDLSGETNYESNGAEPLIFTKGTRSIQSAQQIVNLDQWVSADAPAPAPSGNWDTKGIPAGATPQNGTFTASVVRNIRRQPGLNGEIIDTPFTAGASQKYDCYVDADNFRWVSWVGASGHRNYTAVRRLSDNKRYGKCF